MSQQEIKKYLQQCRLCPRNCGVNRYQGMKGYCQAPYLPKAALAYSHLWEEPPISGTKGSGTIFFSHCNLKCLFCQNYTISTEGFGKEISTSRLAEIMLEQQERGCHNINLVSPTPYIPQIREALISAKNNHLQIPVVYNTNGYESVEALQQLEGLIDIYLPDFKYIDEKIAKEFSDADHYSFYAKKALLEMYRQVGDNQYNEAGLLKKGMIIRHLVLPGHYRDSFDILDWLKSAFGSQVTVSLCSQYTPMYRAFEIKELSRRLTTYEYQKVIDYFFSIGLKNGFMQRRTSATKDYTPHFDLTGIHFEKNV